MPTLEHNLRKGDWADGIAMRNGHALVATEAAPSKTHDTGPWEPVIREITSYLGLDDNWDGYGAEAPSREVLESAIGLAYCYFQGGVGPPNRVAPGVAGSVIFEWQDPDGLYATVEIDGPLHAEVMVVEPGKPVEQWILATVHSATFPNPSWNVTPTATRFRPSRRRTRFMSW